MQQYLRSIGSSEETPATHKSATEIVIGKILGLSNTASTNNDGSKYGAGVRSQVFEVIVRQAIAGAPWQEICQGPMQVNNITIEEVEEELRRRGGGEAPGSSRQTKAPSSPDGGAGNAVMTLSSPSQRINKIRQVIEKLASGSDLDQGKLQKTLSEVALELQSVEFKVEKLQMVVISDQAEAQLQGDLNRELGRRPEFQPGDDPGPHHIT
ncbi:MAG: hypothetical protein WC028_13365 [Candidatus Obscuribacterales bacterium]